MVNAHEVQKLAERLTKAEALVAAGAVFPVAGLDGYAVVRNGDGSQFYLVRWDAGREHCSCPDFQHRQGKAQQPCKHLLAAQLALDSQPTSGEPRESLQGTRSVALLNGELDEVDRLDEALAARSAA